MIISRRRSSDHWLSSPQSSQTWFGMLACLTHKVGMTLTKFSQSLYKHLKLSSLIRLSPSPLLGKERRTASMTEADVATVSLLIACTSPQTQSRWWSNTQGCCQSCNTELLLSLLSLAVSSVVVAVSDKNKSRSLGTRLVCHSNITNITLIITQCLVYVPFGYELITAHIEVWLSVCPLNNSQSHYSIHKVLQCFKNPRSLPFLPHNSVCHVVDILHLQIWQELIKTLDLLIGPHGIGMWWLCHVYFNKWIKSMSLC